MESNVQRLLKVNGEVIDTFEWPIQYAMGAASQLQEYRVASYDDEGLAILGKADDITNGDFWVYPFASNVHTKLGKLKKDLSLNIRRRSTRKVRLPSLFKQEVELWFKGSYRISTRRSQWRSIAQEYFAGTHVELGGDIDLKLRVALALIAAHGGVIRLSKGIRDYGSGLYLALAKGALTVSVLPTDTLLLHALLFISSVYSAYLRVQFEVDSAIFEPISTRTVYSVFELGGLNGFDINGFALVGRPCKGGYSVLGDTRPTVQPRSYKIASEHFSRYMSAWRDRDNWKRQLLKSESQLQTS